MKKSGKKTVNQNVAEIHSEGPQQGSPDEQSETSFDQTAPAEPTYVETLTTLRSEALGTLRALMQNHSTSVAPTTRLEAARELIRITEREDITSYNGKYEEVCQLNDKMFNLLSGLAFAYETSKKADRAKSILKWVERNLGDVLNAVGRGDEEE